MAPSCTKKTNFTVRKGNKRVAIIISIIIIIRLMKLQLGVVFWFVLV